MNAGKSTRSPRSIDLISLTDKRRGNDLSRISLLRRCCWLLLLLFLQIIGTGPLAAQKIEAIRQGANGPAGNPQDPVEWITGNLNETRAHYLEGMTVPYQLEAIDLSFGETYCVTINWNTKYAGKHTVDFLTSYDRRISHDLYGHPLEAIDPLLGTSLEGQDITPQLVPIPVPKTAGSPVPGQPATAFNALPEEERQLAIFNGQILNYGYVYEETLTGNDTESALQICFTVNAGAEAVVITWGGHIAEPLTWGKGKTASGEEGNPFVTSITECDGILGCGSRNLTLQASFVDPGTICGISGPEILCSGETVAFNSMAPDLGDDTLSWNLVNEGTNATIDGLAEGAEVLVNAGTQAGFFELTFFIGKEESCSRRIFVYQPDAVALSPGEANLCEGAVSIPVEWINLPDMDGIVKELTLLDENENLIGTVPTVEELFQLLPEEEQVFYIFGTAYLENKDCPPVETGRVSVRRQLTAPVADIQVDDPPFCTGMGIVFTGLTPPDPSSSLSWFWEFGDGYTSDQQNPVHAYEKAGTYTVTLTVFDEFGCPGAPATREVSVLQGPQAAFTGDSTACEDNMVSFSNSSTSGDAPISGFEWMIDDDPAVPGFGLAVPFEDPGVYSISLIATDENGCVDTLEEKITILEGVTVSAGADQEGCRDDLFQLQGHIEGSVATGQWSDGGLGGIFLPDSSSLEASYTPPAGFEGMVMLRLTSDDPEGLCGPESDTLLLRVNPKPAPDFAAAPVCEGDATFFNNLSPFNAGDDIDWFWNFGDGGTSTSPNPGHLYSEAGIYTVSLQMTDANGCSNTVEKAVEVFAVPQPSFTTGDLCEIQNVQFTNTSKSGEDAIFEWQFGDGFGSLSPDPNHLYGAAGPYTVSLTVTDVNGCSATTEQTIEILKGPEAFFTVEEGCQGEALTFVSEATPGDGALVTHEWRFGDGAIDTGAVITHVYDDPGAYLVRLEVTDENGCWEAYRIPVDVLSGVIVDAGSDKQICQDGFVELNGSISGPANAGQWSDGGVGGVFSPVAGQPDLHVRYQPPAGWTDPITLTLTSDDPEGACPSESDELLLTIFSKGNVDAGPDQVACPGGSIQLDGSIEGTVSTGFWSDGNIGGTFEPGANSLNARYIPPADYTQPVTLTLTSDDPDGPCEASSDTLTLSFQAPPQADFQADAVCEGNETIFENLSTTDDASASSWFWDFGDGKTGAVKNPTHSYAGAGEYQVALTVTSSLGCEHTTRRMVQVFRLPEPAFTVEQPCEDQAAQFRNNTSEGDELIRGFEWRFGEGSSSQEVEPAHTYRNPGSFPVTLLATDWNGCSNRVEETVLIRQKPEALFEASDVCLGEQVIFDQQSMPGEGAIRSFEWDFGDGSNSDEAAPAHHFQDWGTYPVRLSVKDEFGCSDTYQSSVAVVEPVTVDAGPDKGFCEDGAVQLNGLVSGSVNSGLWSDGGIGGQFIPGPQALNALYVLPEGYREDVVLTLTSDDSEGLCEPVSDELSLYYLAAPVVAFQAEVVCDQQPVQFEHTSTAGSGVITDVFWDFGDGQSSGETAPGHVYSGPGTYEVTLQITNSNGCTQSLTQPVTIPPRPFPNFVVDGACPGQPMTFTNLSVVGAGLDADYFWDFGDGSTSTVQDPVHTYDGGESYRVRLRVTDENGCSTSLSKEVTLGTGPQASFIAEPVCLSDPMTFINTSQADAAALTKYHWDFGDGTSSEEANPVHQYKAPGTYTVELTIEDNNGCQGTATRTVRVYALPEPDFATGGTCENQQLSFTDLSEEGDGALTGFFWDFGDGATSTNRNPAHTYPESGAYKVQLIVEDENGCVAASDRDILINTPPNAAFSAQDQCVGTPVTFNNNSLAGSNAIDRYEWQFGDGTASSQVNPEHTYAEAGAYTVVLTVFDTEGCSDSQIGEIVVFEAPAANFTTEVFCESRAVQFTSFATVGDGSIASYSWDFGDGGSSQTADPKHTFPNAGSFSVTLEVATDKGCSRSLTKAVLIPDSPTAAFTVVEGCEALGPDLLIVNESEPAPGSTAALSYLWIVRDDKDREVARSREETPDFNLPPGLYTLELTASDGLECSGYASREIRVYPDPSIFIEAAALRVCNGEGTTLTAVAEGGMDCRAVQWQWANTPTGPWNILASDGLSYATPSDLSPATYYYRARYRCDGNDCNTATSNVVAIEVGQGEAELGCLGQLNVTLDEACTNRITPAMVGQGTFGHCFPYRVEDFEVIVYDGEYPNGEPDNVVEKWGLFSYQLKLKEEAIAAGGAFDACWGNVLAVDLTPPQVDCPSDVTGLIRAGDQYRPAFDPGEAQAGEAFHYLTCNELDFIYQEERSWQDENYDYYTGLPQAIDACNEATLVKVEDWLVKPGCEDVSLAFGGQLSAKVIRTFTYQDTQGNTGTCDQAIYFFRPWIQLPDCEVHLDLCEYGDDQLLDPADIGIAPYYFNGLGEKVLLLNFDCGFSIVYEDQYFPGPENCGFKIRRTWTLLDDCRSAGLPVDLVDLPASAEGCTEEPAWEWETLTFEQTLIVEDARAPVVECPAPPEGTDTHIYSTGPFNCTAVINPPAPVVSGECQGWIWSFEVYGFVVNPLTMIPEYKRIGASTDHLLSGVPPGEYDLIYTVEDACGNKTVSEKCPIRVADQINPIAICDNELNISLGTGSGSGVAMLLARDIGEGSWDNCTAEVDLAVRRIIGGDCLDTYVKAVLNAEVTFADLRREVVDGGEEYYYNGEKIVVFEGGTYWSAWRQGVITTCCDAGLAGGVQVVLRAMDEAGNTNTCEATIMVDDQLPPRCSVQDQVIACTELDFDPRDPVQVAARFGAPQEVVTVFDNCDAGLSEQLIWSPENCGRGTLERVFTVTDASGLTGVCTQTISVEEVVDYEIKFPADASNATCGEAGGDDVLFETFGCDLLAVDRDTVSFDAPDGGCHQIMIHYEIINWCEYNAVGNTTPTRIFRDVDDDDVLEEPTWVTVAFDPAFDAIVAKVFGADGAGNRQGAPSKIYKPGDAGYNPGYFRFTQMVNIIDNQGPTVEVLTEDLSFCSFDGVADGCSGDFSIRVNATDNCPLSTVALQEVKLLAEGVEIPSGAYQIRQLGEDVIISGNVGIGAYRLSLRFNDGCGNPTGRNIDFEVVDCQAPVPNCKALITADLPPTDTDGDGWADTGENVIPAEAMIASEITDCSPFPDEPVHQVKYFVSRERPQSVEDLTEQSLKFTCDDNGVITVVYLSALDAAGNFGTCEVRVFIEAGNDPNPCDLFSGEAVIGGKIRTEEGDPVEDVMVQLSGRLSDFVMTDYNGMYRFENLEGGYDYTVSPLKDDDYVNGVTTFDLLLISKHILAEDPLDSPYQLIAADANSDGHVTTFDLIQLRKLILTLSFDLDNNTSWRFIDADYVFPDPTNPWLERFPEVININDLDGIVDDGDFVAVKIGDVNGNAQTSRLVEPEVRSGRDAFLIRTEDQTLLAGREYVIPITAEGIQDIEGYQFTLEVEPSFAGLVDVQYGLARPEHFGVFPDQGVVTTSWIKSSIANCETGLPAAGCRLFSLVLRPLRQVKLSEIMAVSSRYTPAEAYTPEGTLLDVALRFEEGDLPETVPFKLYPNRPNPWRHTTVIGFTLPEAGPVTLRVVDVNGRELYRRREELSLGYNEFQLEKGQLPAGVLYYVVETPWHTGTRKMILMR